MTLTPKSPACILYAAMRDCSVYDAVSNLSHPTSVRTAERYTAAAKAVRDAALDEAAVVCETEAMEHNIDPGEEWQLKNAASNIRCLKDTSP